MGEIVVADIETDSLRPKQIYMLGILNLETDEYTAYIGDDEVPVGLMRLAEAERVIGHNFKGYDAPTIEKLTDGLIVIPKDRIDDTLEISRELFPDLVNHKLATWGEILGYPKLEMKIFERFTPEMIPYCERDVRLNAKVYRFFIEHLEALEREEA